MIIKNFRPFSKNTLRACFDVKLSDGIEIRECRLQEHNGYRWVAMPGYSRTNPGNGPNSVKWVPHVILPDSLMEELKAKALEQLEPFDDKGPF